MFPSLEKLHHSIVVTGNRIANLALIKTYLQEQGIASEGNPDVVIFDIESLGIEIVREQIVPLVSAQKISKARFMILSFDRATMESQNGLLKSIEEPQVGTYFFILVPGSEILLPTILSRSQIVAGAYGAGQTRLDVSEFLKANLAARFKLVEDWTKNKKDEDNLTKTEVINFLDQLEKTLWGVRHSDEGRNPGSGKSENESIRSLDPGLRWDDAELLFADIRKMREYANIRGASHRVILDYISMIAPVVK